MKYYISDSKLNAKGCFANRKIKSGSLITRLGGKRYSKKQMIELVNRGIERNFDDPLQIDDNLFIDLKYKYLMFNHSCNPNAGIKGKNELIAIKDIQKGDEITFDYSTTVGKSESSWNMNRKCNCNSENCRGKIGSIISVPKSKINEYLNAGVLQDFIRKQLK